MYSFTISNWNDPDEMPDVEQFHERLEVAIKAWVDNLAMVVESLVKIEVQPVVDPEVVLEAKVTVRDDNDEYQSEYRFLLTKDQ